MLTTLKRMAWIWHDSNTYFGLLRPIDLVKALHLHSLYSLRHREVCVPVLYLKICYHLVLINVVCTPSFIVKQFPSINIFLWTSMKWDNLESDVIFKTKWKVVSHQGVCNNRCRSNDFITFFPHMYDDMTYDILKFY